MKKCFVGLLLWLCASAAFGQTTQIIASHINYFAAGPVTGTFCVTPALANGQPVNLTTPGGQQLAASVPTCFPIASGVLDPSAVVPDTSLAIPVNACIRISIYDASGLQVGNTYPCAQPSGQTWSFDTYAPSSFPGLPLLPPLFYVNGVQNTVQNRLNLQNGAGISITPGLNGAAIVTATLAGGCSGNENVTFATTNAFSTTTCSSREVLIGNTAFSLAGGSDGQVKCLEFVHDSSSNLYTVTPPNNVAAFFAVGNVPSKRSQQCFTYYQADAAWIANNAGVVNQ